MSTFGSSPSSSAVTSLSRSSGLGPVLTVESTSSPASTSNVSTSNVSTTYFVTFLIAVIISWILVDLWTKVIDNLAYVTFNMKSSSTLHSFIVAGVCTLIFLSYILIIEPVGSDIRFQMVGSGAVGVASMATPLTQ